MTHCQSSGNRLWWSSFGSNPSAHCSCTMSPFNFHAIQTLEIGPDDQPKIDVQNGRLVLTALRGADQIMITAPLNSVITTPVNTTVKASRPAKRRPSFVPKNNVPFGEDHRLAKLKEEDVRKIRSLASDPSYMASFGSKHAALKGMASMLNVHFTTVLKVIEGKSWKHVQ